MEFRRLAVSLLTGGLLGKVAGLGRELALAALYGTGDVVAALRVAQAASLVPVNFVTSDALNAGFLPLYQGRRENDPDSAHEFYRAAHVGIVSLVVAVSAAVLLGARLVVTVIAPGLAPTTVDTAASMLRVLALGMPFYISGVVRSYLALALGRPQLVSLRATIVNLGMLGGIAVAALSRDWIWLAAGFSGGSVVYAGWTYAFVARHGLGPSTTGWLGAARYRAALLPLVRVMRGLLVLPLLVQCNEVAERVVASLLGERVVAATEYANFLVDSVVTLLAVPLGLAGLASVGPGTDAQLRARARIVSVAAPVMALTVPMSAILAMRADDLVALVYARGAFDAASVEVTGRVLVGFAVGLWAQVLGYVAIRTFSGTLRTTVLVRALAGGFVAGLTVLAVAVPTRDAVFIGLSGTVYGVVSLVLVCAAMSAVSVVGRWAGAMAPGVVLLVALDAAADRVRLLEGHPLVVCAVLVVAWAAYCLAVPRLRAELGHVARTTRS